MVRLPFATKEKMDTYKQSGFVSFAFPGQKSVVSNVRSPERGERVMLAATKSGEAGAGIRLCPVQKRDTLL